MSNSRQSSLGTVEVKRRGDVLAELQCVSDAEVRERLGDLCEVRDLRDADLVLGLWDAGSRSWLYPRFQFELGDGVAPEMAALLELLPKGDGLGWGRLKWLLTPNEHVNHQPPIEVFESDPDAVIAAAREQFGAPKRVLM